jgi:hypothetical protein
LRQYLLTGDARYVRTTQRLIAPYSQSIPVDPAIRILQARLQQSAHRFFEAVQTLQPLLGSPLHGAEASLLTADSLRRNGQPGLASKACLQLALSGRGELSRICAAEIRLANGDPEAAWRILQPTLALASELVPAERSWVQSVAAEIAAATGDVAVAQHLFEKLKDSGDMDLASRLAYADLLLMQDDYTRALQLLDRLPPQTSVLLRIARARIALSPCELKDQREVVRLSLIRAETVDRPELQLRNRALLELWLEYNPAEALAAATANWHLQKSFEDTDLLRTAALAANNSDTLQMLAAWEHMRLREVGP